MEYNLSLNNYEVQKRDGTTVSNVIADKVVKRHMLLFGTLVFPTIMGAVLTFFSGRKHSLKEVAPWSLLLLSALGIYWSNTDYQIAKHSKDSQGGTLWIKFLKSQKD